jgi:N-acetylglutamate synthase-like GNAT family acetyltransferase
MIRKIIRQARLNPLSIRWPAFVMAEELSGSFLGCAQLKIHKDGSCELASLYVKPEHRNRGVAAALIQHLQEQSSSNLWLTCRSGLIPFYQRFAFIEIRETTRMPAYFRRVWHVFRYFERGLKLREGLAVMLWQRVEDND